MRYFLWHGALLLMLLSPPAWSGGNLYKYRDTDGNVWFTDRPASGAQLDEMEFLGYHGRPTARVSCVGPSTNEGAQRVAAISRPLREYTRRFNIDYALAKAIIAVESCFDPNAVSRVGAEGLMQLMPGTAATLGVEDSFDIHQNLRGGVEYFRMLYDRYRGDTSLALAAYNAGPTAVDRHDGIPPYDETIRYVDRVLDHWNRYREQATE